MDTAQKQQIDQAVQELRKAFIWRAELCAQIAKIVTETTQYKYEIDPRTMNLKPVDLPYQHEYEQLEEADQLIARLMHQIQMVSMSPSVYEWQKRRNEIVSAEQMVALAKLDLLKPAMLNLDVLPFD